MVLDVLWTVVCVVMSVQGAVALVGVLRRSITQKPTLLSPTACKALCSYLLSYAIISVVVIMRNEAQLKIYSVAVAFVIVFITVVSVLHIASRDRVFTRTKLQLLSMLHSDLAHVSMKKIRRPDMILWHALSKACAGTVSSAMITSVAIWLTFVMLHLSYINWDVKLCKNSYILLLVAFLYAGLGMIIVFLLLFRAIPLFPSSEVFRITAIALFSAVIIGCNLLCQTAFGCAHSNMLNVMDTDTSDIVKVGACLSFLCVQFIVNIDHRQCARNAKARCKSDTDRQDDEKSVIDRISQRMQLQRNAARCRQVTIAPRIPTSRVCPVIHTDVTESAKSLSDDFV